MVPIRESMQDLSLLARELNAETDSLNGVIQSLEDQLAASKVGVAIWLPHLLDESAPTREDESREIFTEGWLLGYAKIGDAWRIAVKRVLRVSIIDGSRDVVREDVEDQTPPMPLTKAPRVVRVEAAQHLESLIEALATRVRRYISSIKDAKRLVE